ncbi:DUF3305 domain-containing protein [Bradyrhizobium lablabi]|uniref:DUF3305 domain-containing protein n=1 Tax=Bradyrhizobium lablabi TaxID=722472 RepID=UPI002010F267|nr:DUF3305 domain-containing protein [Bradyrhizobium lablabi]
MASWSNGVRGRTAWADFLWRPVSVFAGSPSAAPWTPLDRRRGDVFYAGEATIELHRTETGNHRDNLAFGSPTLWVNQRLTGSEPPYELLAVTADPAEGAAFTDAGSNLVDAVPMPAVIVEPVERFASEDHVDRPFIKRQRNRQGLRRRTRESATRRAQCFPSLERTHRLRR